MKCDGCSRPLEHHLSLCVCTYSDSELAELVAMCLCGIDSGADLGTRLLQAEEEIQIRHQFRSMPSLDDAGDADGGP